MSTYYHYYYYCHLHPYFCIKEYTSCLKVNELRARPCTVIEADIEEIAEHKSQNGQH